MKPPPFAYYAPESLAEAVGILARVDNARVLAGGQSLMPMLNMRLALPDHVIDINRIPDLAYIREAPGGLEIGAMTRQWEVEASATVRTHCPLLHEAISLVGHRATRNRGTVGGSLCHLDPAAELVTAAAALDATMSVLGRDGSRDLDFDAFALDFMTSALAPDEMLTAVRFGIWPAGHGWCFTEFARRHGDFAVVSAAALIERDGAGRIRRASLTLGGVGPLPVRVRAAERMLAGEAATPALLRAAAETCRAVEAMEDIHAGAAYRRQLAAVLGRRALERACQRAAGTVP